MVKSPINRIQGLFQKERQDILSIFFTAGYPQKEDTRAIIRELDQAGVDMIEIGMPYSDPIADGSTIQQASTIALNNGMSIPYLFEQLAGIREITDIPLLLMGYINPVLQYGLEKFLAKAAELGMDGLILPDLPMTVYEREYQQLFQQHGLSNVFLVTPQTSESRIRKIDDLSDSFIYVVSSASTTGKQEGFGETHGAYFQRIAEMKLKNPCIVGFGISNHQSYMRANHALDGAIIGSAFIKAIGAGEKLEESIPAFVHHIRQP